MESRTGFACRYPRCLLNSIGHHVIFVCLRVKTVSHGRFEAREHMIGNARLPRERFTEATIGTASREREGRTSRKPGYARVVRR